jgi:hypothetical protein
MRAAPVIASLVFAVGCQVQPTPARNVRPPETTCRVNSDCVVFDEDIAGPTACCGGCTQRSGNRNDVERFRRECASGAPRTCPPIDCIQPIVHAVCRAGRCALAHGQGSPPVRGPSAAPR